MTTVPDARAGRAGRRLLWTAVALIALVAAAFGADAALRSYAEHRFVSEIDAALPAGVSTPGLQVKLHGFSFFAQYLRGEFGAVDISAPSIRTRTGTVAATVHATDVTFDKAFKDPVVVGSLSGSLRASETQVNRIVQLPDQTASLSIGKNTVTYSATAEVLGLPLGYSATVRPEITGDVVELYPENVNVASGPVDFDVKQLLGGVFTGKPIPVCIAPYLPSGLNVKSIGLASRRVSVAFSATSFSLDTASFDHHDSCPA